MFVATGTVGSMRKDLGAPPAWMVSVAVFIGLVACIFLQSSCFSISNMADGRPDGGTPRADYCGVVDHDLRWVLFPCVAALIAVVAFSVLRRVSHREWWALGLVLAIAIVNGVIVQRLGYFTPLP
jgi:hypothetical protein